jgi:hypothetical protein
LHKKTDEDRKKRWLVQPICLSCLSPMGDRNRKKASALVAHSAESPPVAGWAATPGGDDDAWVEEDMLWKKGSKEGQLLWSLFRDF